MIDSTEVTLIGVNGSGENLAAVKWVADRATRFDDRIHILCTYALTSYSTAALDGGYAVLDDKAFKRGAQQVIEEAVEIAKSRGGVRVSSLIEPGDPADVLVEMSHEVDLVVVDSQGGDPFADRLLGTVSSVLPARAQCPVVVVPCHIAGKKFMPVERIIVGVDGSEAPSPVLHKAVDEAEGWGARLTAIPAVPIGSGTLMMAQTPDIDHSTLLDNVRKGMEEAIDQVLHGRTMEVVHHALDGAPASLLIEFLTTVDLIVVSMRPRGRLADIPLGPISQTVSSHSTCPVMIVPSNHLSKAESATTPNWGRRQQRVIQQGAKSLGSSHPTL